MKNLFLFLVFAALSITSCTKATTSNLGANNSTNLTTKPANSANTGDINLNTNTSNQSPNSQTKSEVNSDMLRQIEAQQLETADPRKVTRQNNDNSSKSAKKSVTPGMQN